MTGQDAESAALVDVVEVDRMTGNERLLWQHVAMTETNADEVIAWREANITNRYGYRKVPTGSWTDD